MPVARSPVPGTLPCPSCAAPLDPAEWESWREAVCPSCRTTLSGALLPAWSQSGLETPTLSERAAEGEAVCFFHPENRASLTCDRCGRFVCALCDMPVGSRHLCPSCLSSGLGQEKLPEIVPWRFLWSACAFWLGIAPLLLVVFMWPVTIVTGPAAIIVALMGWKRPGSLPQGRRHWMAVVGLIFGLVQVGLWIGAIALIVNLRSSGALR